MTLLDSWLEQATRCLSKESAAQVRTEIRDHHELQREAAMKRGASAEQADRLALSALGDAKAANRQYRKVLLTSAEVRMLRDSHREARAICSRPWLKWMFLVSPLAGVLAAAVFLHYGAIGTARTLLVGGAALAVFFSLPLLPIYTPWRSRIYRLAKWTMLVAALVIAFGQDAFTYSWLAASCLWIPLWTEWTRISIRRKLPVTSWPRHLYL